MLTVAKVLWYVVDDGEEEDGDENDADDDAMIEVGFETVST